MERELMAVLIEVTSVAASGRNLRKPITIPRPNKSRKKSQALEQRETAQAYAKGISVLQRSAKAVSR